MKQSTFASLLHAFFHEWMGKQRNLSHHTVCSYRDTWKMFLQFTASREQRQIAQLSLADLQAGEVLAFLDYLEKDRKVSIGTRNCRLAAIHSFFAFVAHREPLAIAQCTEDRTYSGQEDVAAHHVQHGCRGNCGVSSRARPIEPGRAERSRVARVPLQHGGTNPGGAGCVSTSHSL